VATKSTKDFERTELFTAFEKLEDSRSSISKLHPLVTVLSIAVAAVLCGAEGPAGIRYRAEAGRKAGQFFSDCGMASPLGTDAVEFFVHCSLLLCYSDSNSKRDCPSLGDAYGSQIKSGQVIQLG